MGAWVPYSLLEVPLLAAIYYHFVVVLPGHGQVVCPWHLSSYLVGNYTPPTTVPTCRPVLVILTSGTVYCGAAIRYPTYPVILCTLLK